MKSLALLLIVLLIWTVGLMTFTGRVARSTPAPTPEPAEAIVALTGNSALRITAAMKLLEDGKGTRLLVSGVNRKATRADVRAVARAPGRIYDCCVDLGFMAANTLGNAQETAAWARSHGFTRLIVVTADYHMPRAVLELKGALPEGRFTPYPVATDEIDVPHWWKRGPQARRMVLEYCKYLVILAREAILSLGPKEHPKAAPASPAPKPHLKIEAPAG